MILTIIVNNYLVAIPQDLSPRPATGLFSCRHR